MSDMQSETLQPRLLIVGTARRPQKLTILVYCEIQSAILQILTLRDVKIDELVAAIAAAWRTRCAGRARRSLLRRADHWLLRSCCYACWSLNGGRGISEILIGTVGGE